MQDNQKYRIIYDENDATHERGLCTVHCFVLLLDLTAAKIVPLRTENLFFLFTCLFIYFMYLLMFLVCSSARPTSVGALKLIFLFQINMAKNIRGGTSST